ncbi:unnamed protein product [Schistosoma margrebowiei]|uniref:Uncharacterized protein n=1 Tax=Schistosoma margrebowiei TaxID=48269 RepID=A0A183N837_9TREM|nr:unnamed protein product [Schistosoma margrebowiei]
MRTLSSVSTRIQHRQVALPRELSTCTRVFIRVDSVRKPWQQPYEGSFHMIARHEKTFKVGRYGRVEIVSIDRLKPAHVDDSALSDNLRFNARPIKPTSGILKPSSGPTLDTSKTSFSRPGQQHASSALSTDEAIRIDRLKPAHVDDSALSDNLRFNARPIKPTSGILKPSSGPTLDTSKTSFSRPGQQHASSALSTDEATVSRPDQQTTPPLTSDEIAGSRDANETTVSRSGRRVR